MRAESSAQVLEERIFSDTGYTIKSRTYVIARNIMAALWLYFSESKATSVEQRVAKFHPINNGIAFRCDALVTGSTRVRVFVEIVMSVTNP